jgi:hypothetical protein
MRNFKLEDFSGCGQFLVRSANKPSIYNPAFLSTILYKVSYQFSGPTWGTHQIVFVSMSDGLISTKFIDHSISEDEEDRWYYFSDPDQDLGGPDRAKQKLVDYLNDPKKCKQEYRFATHEELMLFALHQTHRTKPYKE